MCKVIRAIIFLGPDGVGKTTQCKLIQSFLNKRKYKTKIVGIRSPHLLAYLFRKFLTLVGPRIYIEYERGYKKAYPHPFVMRKLAKLWIMLEMVSAILVAIWRVHIPLRLGYIVIAERYLLDTYTNLLHTSRIYGFLQNISTKLLLSIFKLFFRLIPKDSLHVILDADFSTLKQRYQRRKTPIELPHFVHYQRRMNLKYMKIINCHSEVLFLYTTNKNIPEVFKTIILRIGAQYDY